MPLQYFLFTVLRFQLHPALNAFCECYVCLFEINNLGLRQQLMYQVQLKQHDREISCCFGYDLGSLKKNKNNIWRPSKCHVAICPRFKKWKYVRSSFYDIVSCFP